MDYGEGTGRKLADVVRRRLIVSWGTKRESIKRSDWARTVGIVIEGLRE